MPWLVYSGCALEPEHSNLTVPPDREAPQLIWLRSVCIVLVHPHVAAYVK